MRYRKGNATLRIGARLYGIKTFATLGSGEPIKRDAEFEQIVLDALLREDLVQYESLAAKLVLKRLEIIRSSPSLTEAMLPLQFEELSSDNYYRDVALDIVNSRDGSGIDRPHMARFKEAAFGVIPDRAIANELVAQLAGVNYPGRPATTILAGGGGGIF